MQMTTTFDEALDAIEHLPAEEQADLIEVMRRRLAERGRRLIADDVRAAKLEHAHGKTPTVSVDDLLREIES